MVMADVVKAIPDICLVIGDTGPLGGELAALRPLHNSVLHLDHPLTVPDEDAVPNF